MLQLERAGDRQDRLRPPQRPRESDLLRSSAVPGRNLSHRRAIRSPQRNIRNEDDLLGGAVVDDRVVLAQRKAVGVLDRGDGDDLPRAVDLVNVDIREPDVSDLAAVPVLLDCGDALLERNRRVDTVQVIQRDAVGPQPGQADFDLVPKCLWTATSQTALGGHDAIAGDGRDRIADRLFALSAGVRVRRIDHLHPGCDRGLDQLDAAPRFRESVRPEPDAGHIGVPKPHGMLVHDARARPLSMCGPLGFRNRGEASDLRAIDVDLENVLHDHHPTVDEVPPPILDVEMPALLLAQRLIQKFEVSSVVELPRVACLGKTRAVGDRGPRRVLAHPGRVDDQRTWRQLPEQPCVLVDRVEHVAAGLEEIDLVSGDESPASLPVTLDSPHRLSIARGSGVERQVASHQPNLAEVELSSPGRKQPHGRGLAGGDADEGECLQRYSRPSTRVYAATSTTMMAPYRTCLTASGTSSSVSTLFRTVRIRVPTIVPE